MKILLTGDSITDMNRHRDADFTTFSYGSSYPFILQGKIGKEFPEKFQIINRGISGNRITDLYARIKADCWNLQPDFISILIGINDIWHELDFQNGVDAERFDRFYRMFIEDTKKVLPNVKFLLLEPFVLRAAAIEKQFEVLNQIRDRAKIIKKIAEDLGCYFLPLQDKMDEYAEKYGSEYVLFDGVHPSVVGAQIIADEWYDFFLKNIVNAK